MILLYYGRALSSIIEGVTRLARAGRRTSKVRRDFEIITDVISPVSLVTSNIRGSSICSSKSLYKKTSNEILAEMKAVVKRVTLKVPEPPTRHASVCYDLSAVKSGYQTASSLTQTVTTERKGEYGTFRVAVITAELKRLVYFSLTFEFEYFFFCGLLSLQLKTLVLWYTTQEVIFLTRISYPKFLVLIIHEYILYTTNYAIKQRNQSESILFVFDRIMIAYRA